MVVPKRAKKSRNGNFENISEIGVLHGVPKREEKAETATLKKKSEIGVLYLVLIDEQCNSAVQFLQYSSKIIL